MAYLFNDISGEHIYTPVVANASTFSFYARFTLNSDTGGGGANRWVASINDPTASLYQVALFFPAGTTNRLQFGFTESGVSKVTDWTTGWTTPMVVALLGTYSGTDLNLYGNGVSTPLSTLSVTATPDQGSQQMGLGCVFIDPPSSAFTAPITLYEAAWWPGTVFNGTQAATLTDYTTPRRTAGITLPANYYNLIADPYDMFGGKNGVNSGAGLVAHAGHNLWPLASTYQPQYQRAPVLAH